MWIQIHLLGGTGACHYVSVSGDDVSLKRGLVCVPALDATLHVALAKFLCELPSAARDRGWAFRLCPLSRVDPVYYARNVLTAEFLRQDSLDYLWFIDADMAPDRRALRVLDVEADIVTGRCLAIQSDREQGIRLIPTAYRRDDDGDLRPAVDATGGPVPIHSAGTANLLIHRRVFEDPRMRLSGDYLDGEGQLRSLGDDEPPAYFFRWEAPNGRILMTADLDFVSRASKLGFECMYHPGARTGHVKPMDLELVERMVASGQAAHSE